MMLKWTVDARYAVGKSHDEAAELLGAAAAQGGIIPWLKSIGDEAAYTGPHKH